MSPRESSVNAVAAVEGVAPVSLRTFALYFLKLGATGFGGPIALAGHMQQVLVVERRWIGEKDYLDGLALAQLAPGPLAAQLAMYLGYVRGGVWGATVVSAAFVLPSFLMVWAISVAYVKYGGLAWMAALFYGIGAAVVGIIARSAYKLTRMTVSGSPLLWTIFLILAVSTAWLERELVWLFLIAGVVSVLLVSRKLGPEIAVLLPMTLQVPQPFAVVSTSLPQLLWFFAKAGSFVFGSGLAVVPFLYGGVVQQHQWLTDRQFLDAVAVAMITPGPVVITVAFVGYLVRGFWGMTVAAVGVFAPVYFVVVVLAPYFRRHSRQLRIRAFVQGVTAAATGAIAGAAVVLARRAFIDVWALAIGALTLAVLTRWKISELWMIAAAAALGLWLRG